MMSRYEIISFTLLLVALFGVAIFWMRRDQRYLKKKTKDAMSDSLREEIDKERGESIRKKALFDEAMRKAQE